MIFAALYLLATVDGILLGHHAAIGRNPLIDKNDWWLRGFLRGFLVGQACLAAIALAVLVALKLSPDPAGFLADGAVAGRAMLRVYAPYAALVLSSVALYFTPWKLLANVLVLGPFTLLRMPVVVVGLALGALARPRWEITLVLATALVTTGSLRVVLRRLTPTWQP